MGKPVLVWLLDGLSLDANDVLLIAYNSDLEKWRMEDRLRMALGERSSCLRIVHLAGPTRGAAETVALALKGALTPAERARKTMLFDCDTFYSYDIVGAFRGWSRDLNMSVVFRDDGASLIYSYCEIDASSMSSMIKQIKEKNRIAPWGNSGCYSFASGEVLLDYFSRTLAAAEVPSVREACTLKGPSQCLSSGAFLKQTLVPPNIDIERFTTAALISFSLIVVF